MSSAYTTIRCPIPECLLLQVHYHVAFGTRYRYEPKVNNEGWRVFFEVWSSGKSEWVEGNSYEVVAK